MSKTRLLIHIVFVTKNRYQTIPLTKRPRVYAYATSIIKNMGCEVLAMNGMSDHIHILINLNPEKALADVVKIVKGSSSKWMKSEDDYRKFEGWGKGYFACSVSPASTDSCCNYINNQEVHHGGKGLLEEIRYMIERSEMKWYEDDWA